jgi:hypothetical protein
VFADYLSTCRHLAASWSFEMHFPSMIVFTVEAAPVVGCNALLSTRRNRSLVEWSSRILLCNGNGGEEAVSWMEFP